MNPSPHSASTTNATINHMDSRPAVNLSYCHPEHTQTVLTQPPALLKKMATELQAIIWNAISTIEIDEFR